MDTHIKTICIALARKNVILRRVMMFIKTEINNVIYSLFYKKEKIDSCLCIFEAFHGMKYCDSPMALYLEMLGDERYNEYKFVWAFRKPKKYSFLEKNQRTMLVTYNSKEYKRAYAKAKYWFTTSRIPDYLMPKEGQIYVQCWHGTPLKRLGFDIDAAGMNAMSTLQEWRNMYEHDAKRYSYMVSPSRFTTEKYISAFNLIKLGKDKCIVETGYPRNDALFTYDKSSLAALRRKMNLPQDKKVILYAPTWRDDQFKAGVGYTYKPGIDFGDFRDRFSEDYVLLFRAHYLVSSLLNFEEYKGFVYDMSSYEDINDLYMLSDMLITDYSSVFVDYANLKRPILFYMYDLDDYKNKMRDFYIDLHDLPGPVVVTEENLYAEIDNIDGYSAKYARKYYEFNEKFNYLDDANASGRVLDAVING